MNDALARLAALAQPTRLSAIRLLVGHEPAGLCPSEMALALQVPQNTLSAHLKILSHAGLLLHQRRGRTIRYRAAIAGLNGLIDYLVDDCCGGRPALCVSALTPCSSIEEKACA